MIAIGGFVRLSGAGLSIVRWQPISGIIPPLNQQKWQQEFEFYQKTPEFSFINTDISLQEFKKIFYIEYFHRNLARFLTFIAFLPFIFCWKKKYHSKLKFSLFTLILIGLQGLAGWLMVASGLKNNPYVSHFNLAIHLLLAFLLLEVLFYKFLNELLWREIYIFDKKKLKNCLDFLLPLIFCILVIQIFFGALTAGLHAGKIFNTFPLMEEQIIPDFLLFSNGKFLTDPPTVQFFHRFFGVLFVILALVDFIINICFFNRKKYLIYSFLLFITTCTQIFFGILTLLSGVELNLALLHQFLAIILFLLVILSIFNNNRCKAV